MRRVKAGLDPNAILNPRRTARRLTCSPGDLLAG